MGFISTWTYNAILYNFEQGAFAEYDSRVTAEYYDDEIGRTILVSTRNEGFELAELEVEIHDGEEFFELEEDLWRYMRLYAERALRDAEEEARGESEHCKYLWRVCV